MSDLSKVCSRLGSHAAGVVLQAKIVQLEGYWIELRCCNNITLMPIRMILRRYGGQHRLDAVLARLSCKQCRRRACMAWLNETPNRMECKGAPPGWSVQLIPFPTAEPMAMAAE